MSDFQNRRTDLLEELYKPTVAIVVYQAQDDNPKYYLESHDINEKGQIMAGRPLMQDTIQEMVDVFFDERKNIAAIGGLLPDNLLSFKYMPGGKIKMAWYRPAEIRVIHFSDKLKLPTGKTWVPALLYVVDGNTLSVYATRSNSRPTDKTKLFIAPFHNIYPGGGVCLGNAAVKKPKVSTYSSLIQYWEDLFWLSEFTHLNGSEQKTATPLDKLWKKLLASKTKLKWSDLNELLPYEHKTISKILL